MRKRIWQLHSWLGLFAGLGLVVIGLTGSVLVFHHEITRALNPTAVLRESPADAPRLPLSQLIAGAESAAPDYWVRGWLLYHGDERRDVAYLTPHADSNDWHIMTVDPATGAIGTPPVATHDTIYGWFVDLHYTFFADHVGLVLTALLAIVFIFLSLSGLYLHRAFFKTLFRLRWGQSWRLFSSDLHKAVGIASIPFNLLLGFTGAYWNIAHVVGELGHKEPEVYTPYAERLVHVDKLPALAEAKWPGYAFNYVYLPTAEDKQFYVFGQTEPDARFASRYGSTLWLDAASLEINYERDLRTAGWWDRAVDAFEPLHFGDFGGLVSKILWSLAGLAPGALTLSGAMIWFHRRRTARQVIATTSPTRAPLAATTPAEVE